MLVHRSVMNSMMVSPKGIEVLAVFVSKFSGEFLKDHAKGEKEECCIYLRPNVNPLTIFAICFLSLVVLAVFLVTALISPRIFWIWRRKHLVKSVDNKIVEALSRVTFSSSRLSHCHTGETCAICLEDYKDGEVLKFLHCQHDFHSSCVESWLTKWGTFCPVCKLDVISKTAFSENKSIGEKSWYKKNLATPDATSASATINCTSRSLPSTNQENVNENDPSTQ